MTQQVLNGPFEVGYCARVLDAEGNTVVSGYGADEMEESRNAQMVCNALNALYYAFLAASPSP